MLMHIPQQQPSWDKIVCIDYFVQIVVIQIEARKCVQCMHRPPSRIIPLFRDSFSHIKIKYTVKTWFCSQLLTAVNRQDGVPLDLVF